jgi:hypothetical protein
MKEGEMVSDVVDGRSNGIWDVHDIQFMINSEDGGSKAEAVTVAIPAIWKERSEKESVLSFDSRRS